MSQIIRSLMLALGQLGDPAILRVLVKSLAITLVIFVALSAALYQAIAAAAANFGAQTDSGLIWLATVVLMVLAIWFLFRIVALAVLQFFADEIVRAVERKHYPQAAASARDLPFREDLINSVKGAGRALLFNALALPIAIILLFTAIGPAIVFLLVNAVLLGRELTDHGLAPAPAWHRNHSWRERRGGPGRGFATSITRSQRGRNDARPLRELDCPSDRGGRRHAFGPSAPSKVASMIRTVSLLTTALLLAGCVSGSRPAPQQTRPAPPVVSPPPHSPTAAPSRPSSTGGFIAPQVMTGRGLEGVIGQNEAQLIRQFGPARLNVWEGDARKLQFSGEACVLDVFLYPLRPGATPSATHIEARRASDGRNVDRAACIAALRRR